MKKKVKKKVMKELERMKPKYRIVADHKFIVEEIIERTIEKCQMEIRKAVEKLIKEIKLTDLEVVVEGNKERKMEEAERKLYLEEMIKSAFKEVLKDE